MARSVQPIGTSASRRIAGPDLVRLAGLAAALLPLSLAGVALAALLAHAPGGSVAAAAGALAGDPFLWRVARFTLWQAGLSAVLSVGLAIPVALALHAMGDGAAKRSLLVLFAVPLALPQIVVVIGITAVWGERGFVTLLAGAAGLDLPSVYGLTGILIAHVFFNMPLAARLLLGALDTMPVEYRRLADQLGLAGFARFRIVTFPAMRKAAGEAAALVFMLCVTSFAVVLTLGGGPRATTLEVALYQALAFDFDLARAVLLTFLQLSLTAAVVVVVLLLGADAAAGDTTGLTGSRGVRRAGGRPSPAVLATLLLAGLFVGAPVAAVLLRGIVAVTPELLARADIHGALATSLSIALASGVLAVLAATALGLAAAEAGARRRFRGAPGAMERFATGVSSLILVVPAMVIAAGWFIALRAYGLQAGAAPHVVVAVNAAMAMPFATRLVAPALKASAERTDRLAQSLGMTGPDRFRLVTWPALRVPAAAALAFAMALSLGDLGVVALFGSADLVTLPLMILRSMGSYRTDDAAGLAFLLALLTMGLTFLAVFLARPATGETRA